jgi:uncharacterized protein YydD (DUF2326 family)
MRVAFSPALEPHHLNAALAKMKIDTNQKPATPALTRTLIIRCLKFLNEERKDGVVVAQIGDVVD